MTPSEYAIWTSVALLGILGSALSSGMETGLYAVNRAVLALRARDGSNRIARMLEREAKSTDRSLATLLIATNAFNYLGALGVTAMLAAQGLVPTELIALNALIITPILLIFAESLPKEIFRRHAMGLLLITTPGLVGFRWLFTVTGLLPLVLAIARMAGRATGLALEPEMGVRQRIAEMLKQDDRVLTGEQAELIDRAMEFRRATVGEEMAPWSRVVCVGESWDRAQTSAAHRRASAPSLSGCGWIRCCGRLTGFHEAAARWHTEGCGTHRAGGTSSRESIGPRSPRTASRHACADGHYRVQGETFGNCDAQGPR